MDENIYNCVYIYAQSEKGKNNWLDGQDASCESNAVKIVNK